jgi:Mg-chelatase subunit ChlD
MNKQLAAVILAVACAVCVPTTHAQTPPSRSLRVLLLVDSSSAVQTMLNPFRAALTAFADGIPETAEVVMVTTGGQFHLKVQPTLDHAKLREAARGFTSDGAANTLLDTMLEADERFLRKGSDRRPVIVILTTDGRQAREEIHIDAYNKFLNAFVARNGRAHGIVVRGGVNGAITDITRNLAQNTGGFFESIAAETALSEKVKQLAVLLAADSQ